MQPGVCPSEGNIMTDWSTFPNDILHKIATYLHAIEDFLSFSAVCHSWRSVYLTKQWQPGPQIPLLMFSDPENDNLRNFLSLYRNKICNSLLPEASGRHCWGTSTEWLITVGGDFQIHLLNPFTHRFLPLPSAYTLKMHFGEVFDIICKSLVVTSNEKDLLVMIIYGPLKQLAFSRPGYSSWISVKDKIRERFHDLVFVRNQIFALCDSGLVLIDIIEGSYSFKMVEFTSPGYLWAWRKLYLVESFGDLWMVAPCRVGNTGSTLESRKFNVFSYDFSERRWISVCDLGNCAIFLGDSCSMCVKASDGLKYERNRIYFTVSKGDRLCMCKKGHLSYGVGVYDMWEGTSEPLCIGSNDTPESYCSPLWLMPGLW